MLREEVKYASKDYVNYLLDKQEYHNEKYTEYDIKQAFEKGAEWADNHPKSPWISVKDDLPCNHEELLKSQESYRTKSVIVRFDNDLHGFAYMIKIDNKWEWLNKLDGITHWMTIPKLPKE